MFWAPQTEQIITKSCVTVCWKLGGILAFAHIVRLVVLNGKHSCCRGPQRGTQTVLLTEEVSCRVARSWNPHCPVIEKMWSLNEGVIEAHMYHTVTTQYQWMFQCCCTDVFWSEGIEKIYLCQLCCGILCHGKLSLMSLDHLCPLTL